ncbi:alpha/beta fold hydrolase [Myxococcus faecalis]|uniref:alpha/beta fold hydrolase n=1 Tax=Myxococcus faecalis TaxID=3115646 RepID=UPI003CF63D18
MDTDTPALASLSIPLASLRMQALEAGPADGPLMLLLHGFPELSESWRDVLPVLGAAGYHAVAPDLRGYGGTDRPRKGYDLDTLAEDIYQLARHLQPDRPIHLVGHDWGGGIAYHVAATRPDIVATLTVVNCPHPSVLLRRIWRPAQLRRSWYMFFFQLPWLPERALSANNGARVPGLIRRGMSRNSQVSDARLAPYAQNLSHPDAARAAVDYYRQSFRDLLTPNGARRLLQGYPRIRAPFRLVWAEEDRALGRELTHDLEPWFELPPQVRFLPGVGHFAPLEAPALVSAQILEHVGTHPPQPTRRA